MASGNIVHKWFFGWLIAGIIVSFSLPCRADLLSGFFYQKVLRIVDSPPKGSIVENVAVDSTEFKQTGIENGILFQTMYIKSGDGKYYEVKRYVITSSNDLDKVIGSETNENQRNIKSFYDYYHADKKQAELQNIWSETGEKKQPLLIVYTDGEALKNSSDYDKMAEDFTPHCCGRLIQLNTAYLNGRSWVDIKNIFEHEFGHFTNLLYDDYLGPDGDHYFNEKTSPQTAFCEGWAEFLAIRREIKEGTRAKLQKIQKAVFDSWFFIFKTKDGKIGVENSDTAGQYKNYNADSLSAEDLLQVEGVNSVILYNLWAAFGKNGDSMVFKTMADCGAESNISDFIRKLIEKYPEKTKVIRKALKNATQNSLTDKDIDKILTGSAFATQEKSVGVVSGKVASPKSTAESGKDSSLGSYWGDD